MTLTSEARELPLTLGIILYMDSYTNSTYINSLTRELILISKQDKVAIAARYLIHVG